MSPRNAKTTALDILIIPKVVSLDDQQELTIDNYCLDWYKPGWKKMPDDDHKPVYYPPKPVEKPCYAEKPKPRPPPKKPEDHRPPPPPPKKEDDHKDEHK